MPMCVHACPGDPAWFTSFLAQAGFWEKLGVAKGTSLFLTRILTVPTQRISSLCTHPNLWLDNEILSSFILVLVVTIFNCLERPGRTCGEGSQGSEDPFPGSGAHSPGMVSCLSKQSCVCALGEAGIPSQF